MAHQKGSTAAVVIGTQADISSIATVGYVMPVNSCGVVPTQAVNTAQTLTGSRNPIQPFRGNKDVAGPIVIPVDSRALWHWLKLMFGAPVTAGGAAAAWQALNNYAAGALVIPTVANGRYYEVTVDAGSSAAAEPTWPTTIGATVVDDGITWTCRAFVHEFKVPTSQPFFTLEQQFTDLAAAKYFQFLGCKVGSFAMEVGGDGELTAAMNVLGSNFQIADASFHAAAAAATIARVSNFQAALTEGGAPIATARSMSLNLDMGLDPDQFVIGGSGVRGSIPEGVVGVSGQLVTLFQDTVLLAKAIAATESALKLTITHTTTSVVEFEIQELEYSVAGVPIETPRGLVVPLNYQGFFANGAETSAIVARLTNIDQHAA